MENVGTKLEQPQALVTLVEEFVEASLDTIELERKLPYDIGWRAHAQYLKGLQREANAVLAKLVARHS